MATICKKCGAVIPDIMPPGERHVCKKGSDIEPEQKKIWME